VQLSDLPRAPHVPAAVTTGALDVVSIFAPLSDDQRGRLLDGTRVLDMTRVLAGPYCTQILGDLGAEVIKAEHPQRGDDTRAWGPPYAEAKDGITRGESAYFLCVRAFSPRGPHGLRTH